MIKALFKLQIGKVFIKYLYKNRCFLNKDVLKKNFIRNIGLLEKGYSSQRIKKDGDLFPADFPFERLLNTNAPDYQFKNKYLFEVRGAYLAGPYALGVTPGGQVIMDMISFKNGRFNVFLESSIKLAPSSMLSVLKPLNIFFSKKKIPSIDTAIVLHSAWNNYFHWVTEHLTKLKALLSLNIDLDQVKIIIPPASPKYVYESLYLFDIKKENIIEWGNDVVRVEKLLVPTFPEMSYETADWLKGKVTKRILATEYQEKKRVFISRKDANVRRIINEDEIMILLSEYGFEAVTLSSLSFREQVELFMHAKIIIAPHGAGLTNILWANDALVIEIFGSTLLSTFAYSRLAEACKHLYDAIIIDTKIQDHEDLKVPISELEFKLNQYEIAKK